MVKASMNDSSKTILLDDEDVSAVFLYGNTAYYKLYGDDLIAIGKIDLDGTNNKSIYEIPKKDNIISNMVVHSDTIYYLLNEKLCSMDLNGGDQKELLTDTIASFCVEENFIYFATDDYIKRLTISSGELEDISKTAADSLCIYDGYIYFQKPSGAMHRLELSNRSVESLGGASVRNYTLDANKIYFIEKFSDDEVEKYVSLLADSEDETDHLFAKVALIGTGKLYSMNLDGTGIATVESDAPILSALYNTPQEKYVQLTFLSKGIDKLTLD